MEQQVSSQVGQVIASDSSEVIEIVCIYRYYSAALHTCAQGNNETKVSCIKPFYSNLFDGLSK